MRRLWLEGEYPSGFLARSPRSCSSAWNPTASGCNQCFYEVPLRRVWNGRWYVSERDHTSIQAQRYCRCMLSKPLNRFHREAIWEYRELRCPLGPVVDTVIGYGGLIGRRLDALIPPPSPPPPPDCPTLLDFVLVLDESGSMRKVIMWPEGSRTSPSCWSATLPWPALPRCHCA